MGKSAKVAVSLPWDILEAVETKRKAKGESCSQSCRRTIERFLKQKQEPSSVRDYVRGYQDFSESAKVEPDTSGN